MCIEVTCSGLRGASTLCNPKFKFHLSFIFTGLQSLLFYFAFSDVGWVVGHSFSVYGPLLAGLTTVLYEGKPVGTPDAANFWRTIERHRVNVMSTAPTALRGIKARDEKGELTKGFDLSCLRALFLAGERAETDSIKWAEHALQVNFAHI